MATIQDIFDWLNQGAQGDIPGTGGEQPSSPAASQSGAEPQATPPGATTPQDYAGDVPPDLVPHYHALVQGGVPPQMAHMILTQPSQPSQGEEKKPGQQESRAYEAGKGAGTSIMHLLFGAPPSQQSWQSEGHQGVIDMLSNWFSPPPQQSSDADLFTGGL